MVAILDNLKGVFRAKKVIFFLLFSIVYLAYVSYIYPYGMGVSIFKEKMPFKLELLFTNSYSKNHEFILVRHDEIDFFIVQKGMSVHLTDSSNIIIEKLLGYSFDKDKVVLKLLDNEGYIQLLNLKIFLNGSIEFSRLDNGEDFINYIDLDRDYNYFKTLGMINRLLKLFIVIYIVYIFLLKKCVK